jgi:hypothetical protein
MVEDFSPAFQTTLSLYQIPYRIILEVQRDREFYQTEAECDCSSKEFIRAQSLNILLFETDTSPNYRRIELVDRRSAARLATQTLSEKDWSILLTPSIDSWLDGMHNQKRVPITKRTQVKRLCV